MHFGEQREIRESTRGHGRKLRGRTAHVWNWTSRKSAPSHNRGRGIRLKQEWATHGMS